MATTRRRVVITGMGAVTPLASNVEDFWRAMLDGRSGIDYTTIFDASTFPTTFSGEVKDASVISRFANDPELSHAGRNVRFALTAGRQAFEHAGLDKAEINKERLGVYLGAGEGPPKWMAFGNLLSESWNGSKADTAVFLKRAVSELNALDELFQEPNIAAGYLARMFSALGPNLTCLTACAASAQAIGEAGHIIRRGDADVMISGGAHSMINPFSQAGFNLLTALSQRNSDPKHASRPFDKGRDGFVLSEGSAMLILEELSHAQARGAKIHGELVGYGTTGDAFRLTDMHPEGRSAKSAMRMALDDARVTPAQVDYINAHGTSTAVNDKIETVAIKDVFGERSKTIPVSSIKSMVGHLIASAGAIEAIACLLAIRDGILPPTTNYETPDGDLDLDYVPNVARKADVRVALSNSFGFGGQNVALVFGRYPM